MELKESFIEESRDQLEAMVDSLLALEKQPDDFEQLDSVFRSIHTAKGASGLFDIKPLTQLLHMAETQLEYMKQNRVAMKAEYNDLFLATSDQVLQWLEFFEQNEGLPEDAAEASSLIVADLEQMFNAEEAIESAPSVADSEAATADDIENDAVLAQTIWFKSEFGQPIDLKACGLYQRPESVRVGLYQESLNQPFLTLLCYQPDRQAFFKGEDPWLLAKQTPKSLAWWVEFNEPWEDLETADVFECRLNYYVVSFADKETLQAHFQYVLEDLDSVALSAEECLLPPEFDAEHSADFDMSTMIQACVDLIGQEDKDGVEQAIDVTLDLINPESWQASVLRWMLLIIERPKVEWTHVKYLLNGLESQQWDKECLLQGCHQFDAAPTDSEKTVGHAPRVDGLAEASVLSLELSKSLLQAQLEVISLASTYSELELTTLMSVHRTVANILRRLQFVDAYNAWSALDPTSAEAMESALFNILQSVDESAQAGVADALESEAAPMAKSEPEVVTTAEPEVSAEVVDVAPVRSQPVVEIPEMKAEPVTESPKQMSESVVEDSGSAGGSAAKTKSSAKIKVNQESIDEIGGLIGEMVVAKNALSFLSEKADKEYQNKALSREIAMQFSVINRITNALQNEIMSVRMLPVSHVFQRFPRLVRDISRKLNKQVDLQIDGQETEADKAVIEVLADPLIHMVRNSLDHGIESPEVRKSQGKPEMGTLWLRAKPENESICITIEDDGKGLNPQVIKEKALQKGLLTSEQLEQMTEQEILHLILMPGFSTADAVTDLSGRGVGMDVVKSTVEGFGGSVDIESTLGQGTKFTLMLPLSMAISNVMQVHLNDQAYGIPMDAVAETTKIRRSNVHIIKNQEAFVLRDSIIPLVYLAEKLNQSKEVGDILTVIVLRHGHERVGLVIDAFGTGMEVVVKPLSGFLSDLREYSGSSILGNGDVMLILEPRELLAR